MRLPKETLSLLLVDLLLVLLAGWLAFWLRFNLDVPAEFVQLALEASPWCLLAYGIGLVAARVYRQVWSYIGLPELRQLGVGIVLGALLTTAAVLMQRLPAFPRSVLLLQPIIALVLLGAARAGWRTLAERRLVNQGGRPLLIVGNLQDASDALRYVAAYQACARSRARPSGSRWASCRRCRPRLAAPCRTSRCSVVRMTLPPKPRRRAC